VRGADRDKAAVKRVRENPALVEPGRGLVSGGRQTLLRASSHAAAQSPSVHLEPTHAVFLKAFIQHMCVDPFVEAATLLKISRFASALAAGVQTEALSGPELLQMFAMMAVGAHLAGRVDMGALDGARRALRAPAPLTHALHRRVLLAAVPPHGRSLL
jgi:hypothetical protein